MTASIGAAPRIDDVGARDAGVAVVDGWTVSEAEPEAARSPTPSGHLARTPARTATRFDQFKDYLAVIGLIAVMFHGLRPFGKMHGI